MEFRESESIELKRMYVDDIRKEIIAMANASGGMIYVGIDDDGSVIGLENCDDTIQRITSTVRDSIKPDITMFLHYDIQLVEDKQIVAIFVQSGTNKPYYLAAKGLRPEGVYVRQGTSSVPASDAAIRQMIKETDGDNYEDMRSLNQTLTFDDANKVFAQQKIEFGISQMQTLGLISQDGLYTNLGLLLSDQCPHIIKAATFNGTDQREFQDRKEFTGSILKQLNDAYDYLALRNQNRASFEGLFRVDQKDYPEVALREALLNAIVHRDYSYSAGTLLSVYSDRIELVSIGGLVHGIALEDVLLGLSVCRNQKLANIFYRLSLIEAYGTGMKKINNAYSESPVKPEIMSTSNAFKITLPKINSYKAASNLSRSMDQMKETAAILGFINEHGSISRLQLESLLEMKTATAIRTLKKLTESNVITPVGKGKNTRYVAAKDFFSK